METGLKPRVFKADAGENEQGLVCLGSYLRDSGYRFTTVTPLTHHYNNQRAVNLTAKNLRDIFGWSRAFEQSTVTEQEFDLMYNAGILARQGHGWRSQVRWSSLDDLLCVHSAYPTDDSDAVFFGPDTYRFAQVIEFFLQTENPSVWRAVDIGCGSGAGALRVARAFPQAQVLAVDINQRALRYTAVNAKLAGAANLEAVSSNLLDGITGDFDLIIANPPYMLDAQQRAYRHGGGELGAGLSVKILEAALSRLARGGILLLYTGVVMIEGRDPFLEIVEQRLERVRCRWHYRELDPDVFSEELLKPAYAQVERIAAVALTLEYTE